MTRNTEKEKIAEEALRDYIKIVEQAESDELMRFMDDNYKPVEKKATAERKYIDTGKVTKPGNGMNRFLRYAAVLVLSITVISIVVPVQEVSAWVVWKFDAIFGETEDHTVTDPADNKDFLNYYMSSIPESFEITNTVENNNRVVVEYTDINGYYVVFAQTSLSSYKNNLDNEHRNETYEIINDFEVHISKSTEDYIFEIMTDTTAISIHTNAGYDVGKKFICCLKEIK